MSQFVPTRADVTPSNVVLKELKLRISNGTLAPFGIRERSANVLDELPTGSANDMEEVSVCARRPRNVGISEVRGAVHGEPF